ncbi:MAG: hypothetical protein ABJA57_00780 [Ginsengibacter sp.]
MRKNLHSPLYIKNEEINKEKWDACISNAGNGLIYAYSFYLDNMCRQWDALVLDDYQVVMPLPFNKKYQIEYLYQPYFTASLGIFGNNIKHTTVQAFLENVPAKFKYWDIYLNRGNFFSISNFELYERNNYVLRLNHNYESTRDNFSENHVRNIKKAVRKGLYLEKNIDARKVIGLAKKQTRSFSGVKNKDFLNFYLLCQHLAGLNKATTYGVFDPSGELLSSAIFFFSNKRIYFILGANIPQSKNTGSSHFLMNEVIREFSGKPLLLDFEGSDIKSIARFYEGFGATPEKYPGLRVNRLPRLIKLFKK